MKSVYAWREKRESTIRMVGDRPAAVRTNHLCRVAAGPQTAIHRTVSLKHRLPFGAFSTPPDADKVLWRSRLAAKQPGARLREDEPEDHAPCPRTEGVFVTIYPDTAHPGTECKSTYSENFTQP